MYGKNVVTVSQLNMDFKEIGLPQMDGAELKELMVLNSSLSFKIVRVPTADITMLCDVSTGTPCPYIPPKFRHNDFELMIIALAITPRS